MYLVDTNIWLEILLEQNKSWEAKLFFEKVETENIQRRGFCRANLFAKRFFFATHENEYTSSAT